MKKQEGRKSREGSAARRGKDELNFAEWTCALHSKRPPKGVKTVTFRDFQDGLERTLTITGSDKFGLPHGKDDEVLFGLVNIARAKTGFSSRELRFFRSELVDFLGWPNTGRSWRYVDHALDVYPGTYFIYKDAWYEKGTTPNLGATRKKYETRKFTPFTVNERGDGSGNVQYVIHWAEQVVRSFQAGAIRNIDLALWRSLEKPISRRLYRHLDKRFWNSPKVTVDVVELGVHKLGLRAEADVGQLKRSLAPAIRELEERGAIEREVPRFKKVGKSHRALFTKKSSRVDSPSSAVESSGSNSTGFDLLLAELTKRRVNKRRAAALLSAKQRESAEWQRIVEWVIEEHDSRLAACSISKTKAAGWLARTLELADEVPGDFLSRRERDQRRAEGKKVEEVATARKKQLKDQQRRQDAAILAYLDSLTSPERETAIERAWSGASEEERRFRRRSSKSAEAIQSAVYRREFAPVIGEVRPSL